ncbi:MAG: glycoside hydrolase family 3 C-terminal domain-containing protein, partial [Terriglobales bacterium]
HAPLQAIFDNSEFVTEPNGDSGLNGEYFDNQELEGKPALTRTDRHIDFRWGEGSYSADGPVDHFSVRWTGYFVPQKTADYNFYSSADDGVRLYLDDRKVIDDWSRHSETLDTYTTHLESGHAYKIRFEYFEAVGSATAGFGVISAEGSIGRETKTLAASADVAIVCVGFTPSLEMEGADRTFALPSGQNELIRQVASVNKNTIVVITAGGNVDMTQWVDDVPGILLAWYPGQEGGRALPEILFGDYSPSGKLPVSFERRWEDNATFHSYYPRDKGKRVEYSEGIFVGYRHFDRSNVKPLFPFGYGLSYTTFKYSNLVVTPRNGNLSGPVVVSFDVTNSGRLPGAEIAELYVGDAHSSVPRPVKELKGFTKVRLNAGDTKRVSLTLDRRAFSYFDVKRKDWNAEPGDFAILIGSSSGKIELKALFTLSR